MWGPAGARAPRTRWMVAWKRFRANRAATTGLVILAALVLCAVLAPRLAPQDPIAVAPRDRLMLPSRAHVMGTDTFGRDVFSRVIYGSRLSLTLGVIAVGIA